MAGSLLMVDTFTVSSAVGSVTLGGGSSGSSSYNFAINTDDVYMATWQDWQPASDTVVQYVRLTKSGTTQSDAEYDEAYKNISADAGFGNSTLNNATQWSWGWGGTNTGESSQGIMYLYNFNSSSLYSFMQAETVNVNYAANMRGFASGGVHTVASASDGLTFLFHSGNIASGTFTLYKVI
tara:strand:- start:49 stop:591 length:543 start_codon:yes stop_codon:yes gene_type:complete